MTPSESLHQLISSLSKSERRSFKLFISKYQSKHSNNYIKLFNAISQQENYNEELIKKQFVPSSTLVKHLPSEKKLLVQPNTSQLKKCSKTISIGVEIAD